MGRRSGDSSDRRQMLASTERKRCLAKRRAAVWVLPRVIMRTGGGGGASPGTRCPVPKVEVVTAGVMIRGAKVSPLGVSCDSCCSQLHTTTLTSMK